LNRSLVLFVSPTGTDVSSQLVSSSQLAAKDALKKPAFCVSGAGVPKYFSSLDAGPERLCRDCGRNLQWNKGLQNLSNQPRSGGYEVSRVA
jgi:hypothetical protein